MKKNHDKKLSALAMARRSAGIRVELTPEDVRRFRPAWSGPEAAYFLQIHKTEIAHVLLASGLAALNQLIVEHESEARSDPN